jgi:hypothetical protein
MAFGGSSRFSERAAPTIGAVPAMRSTSDARTRFCVLGLGMAAVLVGVLVFVAAARAAFPGRNGLLAVQPLSGPGIVLVSANGRGERRVCAALADSCAPFGIRLVRPRWAPDGGSLVINEMEGSFNVGPFEVIYPGGSCLECHEFFLGGWADGAYTGNPTLLTAVTDVALGGTGALVEYGVDGPARRVLLTGAISDPVWSSRGQLALVRDGWIWAGSQGRLRRVARGGAPSWSPDGRQIAFVRSGWVRIGAVHGRSFRRLLRGAAPAWSPDGSWIALFDRHHRLSVVPAGRGKVRRIGDVTGSTVDWQPLPAKPPARCLTPPGSSVIASSDTAIITVDNPQPPFDAFPTTAYLGCYRADGRERLLASYPYPGYATEDVVDSSVAGPYAALAVNTANGHDQTMSSAVNVFDLRTGAELPGGDLGMCGYQSSPPCASTIDQVVLGTDANSAVHMTVRDANCEPVPQPNCMYTVEEILARDRTGVRTLDSVNEPDGSPAQLTNLVLIGNTVTWEDNGTSRSAQLQP